MLDSDNVLHCRDLACHDVANFLLVHLSELISLSLSALAMNGRTNLVNSGPIGLVNIVEFIQAREGTSDNARNHCPNLLLGEGIVGIPNNDETSGGVPDTVSPDRIRDVVVRAQRKKDLGVQVVRASLGSWWDRQSCLTVRWQRGQDGSKDSVHKVLL